MYVLGLTLKSTLFRVTERTKNKRPRCHQGELDLSRETKGPVEEEDGVERHQQRPPGSKCYCEGMTRMKFRRRYERQSTC